MSEPTFTITEDFFNTIELHNAPSRWEWTDEGRIEIPRGRTIERRRDGTVKRDETYDVGCRIIYPHPRRLTLWERFLLIFD